uniref:Uncharacterized protein n=1 Tax=Oryza barthii TaxID=65489 RepID=A0A0D3EP86_9ORYZ
MGRIGREWRRRCVEQSSGGERRIPACVEAGRGGGIELVLPSGSGVEASGGGSELAFPGGGGVDVILPGGSGVDVVLPRGGSGGDVEAGNGSTNSSFPAAVAASMSSFPEAAASMSSFPATAAATAEFTSKSRRRRSRRRRWCRLIENPSASRVQAARPSLPIRRYAIDSEHPGVAWGSRSVTICTASAYGAGNSVAYHLGACFANDIVIVIESYIEVNHRSFVSSVPIGYQFAGPGAGFKNTPMEGLLVPVFKKQMQFWGWDNPMIDGCKLENGLPSIMLTGFSTGCFDKFTSFFI